MNFEFAIANLIIFGPGRFREIGDIARSFGKRAQPFTAALIQEGIQRVARSLLKAYEQGDSIAREDMALASLESGMALANSGLGAAHGFSGSLGGKYSIPHGLACACLLPQVMEANIRSLQTKEPTSPILDRYAEIGEWLIGKRLETEQETRDAGIKFVRELCLRLQRSLPRHWINFHFGPHKK